MLEIYNKLSKSLHFCVNRITYLTGKISSAASKVAKHLTTNPDVSQLLTFTSSPGMANSDLSNSMHVGGEALNGLGTIQLPESDNNPGILSIPNILMDDNFTQPTPPNLSELEKSEANIEKELESVQKLSEKLKFGLDELSNSLNSNAFQGIEMYSDIVSSLPQVESETTDDADSNMEKNEFTPPVIVLLPSDLTPREKMELDDVMKCNSEIPSNDGGLERDIISLNKSDEEELKKERASTEKKLEEEKKKRIKLIDELRKMEEKVISGKDMRADVEFLKKDIQDTDKRIEFLIKKLRMIDQRRNSLNLFHSDDHDGDKKKEDQEYEGEDRSAEKGEKKKSKKKNKTKKTIKSKIKSLFKRKKKNPKGESEVESDEYLI